MIAFRRAAAAALLLGAAGSAFASKTAAPLDAEAGAREVQRSRLSAQAQHLLQWLARNGDHGGRPFMVVDKPQARLLVFDGDMRLVDSTPVLLGLAIGDLSVPGIGERPIAAIKPDERTTPAGRFIAEPGRNASGEDIYWVDYDAAVSLHRVRTNHPKERRLQRLQTPTAADNRISYGCINVPSAFYDRRIDKIFADGHSVIYVLPDTLPFERFFK